jgi:hypothetical protein
MHKRYMPIAGLAACLALSATPALATDDPPPATTPPAATTPAATAPAAGPTAPPAGPACVDLTRPRTRLATSSSVASKKHILRGSALDSGCSTSAVATVMVAVEKQQGKRCQFLRSNGRFSKKSSCSRRTWIVARGTKQWNLRLPSRLPTGKYQILTRAADAAGNVERAHARRLAISRPHSKKTK